jgi:hypothetical protein
MVSLGIPDTEFTARAGLPSAPQTEFQETGENVEITENQETAETGEKQQVKEQEQAASVPVPARRKRKEQPENYRDTYFRRIDFSDRQPLYITRPTHEKMMMIVNIIGGRKATISSYVENILLHHLDFHREEINRLFDEHYLKNKNEF